MFLKTCDEKIVGLEKNLKFIDHYNNFNNYTQVILQQINDGLYKPFLSKINSDSVVLDLGGNIGLFSIYLSPTVKKIISIEPTPSHLGIFKELVENLNVKNVEIVPCAIHTANEMVKFNLCSFNTTMNSIYKIQENQEFLEVQGVTLEEVLKDYDKIDFCKMDIEGYENILLKDPNTVKTISQKIKNIFIEFHNAYDGQDLPNHLLSGITTLQPYFFCQIVSHDSLLFANKNIN